MTAKELIKIITPFFESDLFERLILNHAALQEPNMAAAKAELIRVRHNLAMAKARLIAETDVKADEYDEILLQTLDIEKAYGDTLANLIGFFPGECSQIAQTILSKPCCKICGQRFDPTVVRRFKSGIQTVSTHPVRIYCPTCSELRKKSPGIDQQSATSVLRQSYRKARINDPGLSYLAFIRKLNQNQAV